MLSEADITNTYRRLEVQLHTFLTSTPERDQRSASGSDTRHTVHTGCECQKKAEGRYLSIFWDKIVTYPYAY